jgi:hypothetical protein
VVPEPSSVQVMRRLRSTYSPEFISYLNFLLQFCPTRGEDGFRFHVVSR